MCRGLFVFLFFCNSSVTKFLCSSIKDTFERQWRIVPGNERIILFLFFSFFLFQTSDVGYLRLERKRLGKQKVSGSFFSIDTSNYTLR